MIGLSNPKPRNRPRQPLPPELHRGSRSPWRSSGSLWLELASGLSFNFTHSAPFGLYKEVSDPAKAPHTPALYIFFCPDVRWAGMKGSPIIESPCGPVRTERGDYRFGAGDETPAAQRRGRIRAIAVQSSSRRPGSRVGRITILRGVPSGGIGGSRESRAGILEFPHGIQGFARRSFRGPLPASNDSLRERRTGLRSGRGLRDGADPRLVLAAPTSSAPVLSPAPRSAPPTVRARPLGVRTVESPILGATLPAARPTCGAAACGAATCGAATWGSCYLGRRVFGCRRPGCPRHWLRTPGERPPRARRVPGCEFCGTEI